MKSVYRAAVITVSDRSFAGDREDLSGPAAVAILRDAGFDAGDAIVVPDERDQIVEALRRLCNEGIDLVVTTGGTGVAPRDVTPEATADVVTRRVEGLSEAMRAASLKSTPFAMLSRAICGVAGSTLIINLPGSTNGVRECLAVVLPVLPHALRVITNTSVPDAEHRPAT
jgi:molybdenum cofactor biosynthesis protein B